VIDGRYRAMAPAPRGDARSATELHAMVSLAPLEASQVKAVGPGGAQVPAAVRGIPLEGRGGLRRSTTRSDGAGLAAAVSFSPASESHP